MRLISANSRRAKKPREYGILATKSLN